MAEETALNRAHAAMLADEEDAAARLRFYERLADAELFVLLEKEAEGDAIDPALFAVEEARYLLVFDREERLAEFAGQIVPYAALSGRALVGMLAGQGIGLALNPDVAPSAFLAPAEAVNWLAGMLSDGPAELEARPVELTAPAGLPQALLEALDAKLVTAAGLAQNAYLAAVTYEDGRRGHLLGFVAAQPGAEPALATAANEALRFSGIEAGEMDVAFFAASDPVSAQLARVGLRFDLPAPEPAPTGPSAPGMDPKTPPILR